MSPVCQRCKKQPATVHVMDIEAQEKRERHLCDRCATEEGIAVKPAHVPINEMLASFVMQQATVQELSQLKCPHCHTTFAEFRNGGLLGCPRDYDVFEKALLPLIERAHEGNSRHSGKSPRRLGTPRRFQSELTRLRRELTEALEREDYESAARIRDRISAIEPV